MINTLGDQQMAKRWSPEGGSAHVSAFFSEDACVEPLVLDSFEHTLTTNYASESIVVESENPSARLFSSCFSAEGTITVSNGDSSHTLNAIGVGGDFFSFHPLELLSGGYFDDTDFNGDFCVLDEVAAWKIFGSNDVAGQILYVGDVPLIVRGVVKQPDDKVAKAAGALTDMCYVSYEYLRSYGTCGNINCYEIVTPNPVPDYAVDKLKSSIGINENDMVLFENTARFSMANRWNLLTNSYQRSMITRDISYPYWENIARNMEDRIVVLTVFYMLFLVYSIILTLVLVVILIIQNAHNVKALFIWLFENISVLFTPKGEERR